MNDTPAVTSDLPVDADRLRDEVSKKYREVAIAPDADRVEVTLYYQGTSREYIEFLRNEINGTVRTLPDGA